MPNCATETAATDSSQEVVRVSEKPRKRIAQRYKDLAASALRYHADAGTIDREHTGAYLYAMADLLRSFDKTHRAKPRVVRVVDLTIWHEEYRDGSTATILSPGECTYRGERCAPTLSLVLALLEWAMMQAPEQFQ
jgi:hypothetical protein